MIASQEFEACGTGNDATAEIVWTPSAGSQFDRIDVTAIERGNATSESDFVIRGFRACDDVTVCTANDSNIFPFSGDDGSDNCAATVL